ncbi:hypothetical protein, partial [Neisseria meningitidis]|uniref:hypothetical protein n=1 Tax=Neisseria meningitidis TaxID=487 RepID=UPI001A9FD8D0
FQFVRRFCSSEEPNYTPTGKNGQCFQWDFFGVNSSCRCRIRFFISAKCCAASNNPFLSLLRLVRLCEYAV